MTGSQLDPVAALLDRIQAAGFTVSRRAPEPSSPQYVFAAFDDSGRSCSSSSLDPLDAAEGLIEGLGLCDPPETRVLAGFPGYPPPIILRS